MSVRQCSALAIFFLMTVGASILTVGAPTVTIVSPPNGTILLSRSVNVTGTAAGSEAEWTETSQAEFNAGTGENVVVSTDGTISLGRAVYDDFKDGSINPAKWTLSVDNGYTMTEENGALHTKGTPTSSTWSNADAISSGFISNDVSADMITFSGAGYGYGSGIYFRQDSSNSAGIALHYDWTWGYKRVAVNFQTGGSNTEVLLNDVSANPTPRNFRMIYSQGTLNYYSNNVLVYTKNMNLVNPQLLMHSATESYQTSIDTSWNNVTIQALAGNLISSPYDAGTDSPVLKKVAWTADTPAGAGVAVNIRSSDSQDMSSPTAWKTVSNGQGSGLPAVKRYIQYRAALTRSGDSSSPAFRDITLTFNLPPTIVEVSTDDKVTWLQATGTGTWHANLDLPEGTTYIWARVTGFDGDTAISSVRVEIDTTRPTGTVVINRNAECTVERQVTLTLNASDLCGVGSMMMSENPHFDGADWDGYARSADWTLSEGDGRKTVYVKYRDSNGWESDVCNDSIILDTMPPAGSVTMDGGAEFTRNATVSLTLNATDLTGVMGMLLSNTADFMGEQWMEHRSPHPWTLSPGSGVRTVYVKFRDKAGHVSPAFSDSIIADTLPPAVTVTINGGGSYTRIRDVAVGLSATENYRVASMQVREGDGSFPPGHPWDPFETGFDLLLTQPEGLKNVSVRLMDAAGNIGPVNSSRIMLDYNAPRTAISGLPETSPRARIAVSWNATDSASGILSYDVQYRRGDGVWTDWLLRTNLTTAEFTGADLQTYSFRVRAQDKAGNVEEYPSAVDNAVTIQLPEPVVTMVRPKEKATVSGRITFTGTCQLIPEGRNVTAVEWRADNGTWQGATGTLEWSFRMDTTGFSDGKHVVEVRTFDGTYYSTGISRLVMVSNAKPLDLAMIALGLVVVVVAAAVGAYVVMRGKRKAATAPAVQTQAAPPPQSYYQRPAPFPPQAFPPLPPPVPPPPASAPPSQTYSPPPPSFQPPPVSIPPSSPPAPATPENRQERLSEILKSKKAGLPPEFRGVPPEDLAELIATGDEGQTPDGQPLVKILDSWYFSDESKPMMFLRKYS